MQQLCLSVRHKRTQIIAKSKQKGIEQQMSKKPYALIIMDGFGINERHEGNAIYAAKTPNLDKYMKECPHYY